MFALGKPGIGVGTVLWSLLWVAIGSFFCGCDKQESNSPAPNQAAPQPQSQAQPKPGPDSIELVFTYGSEKENWIKRVTGDFNSSAQKIGSGKRIVVTGYPMGSGESIDELLAGRRKAHITSPASLAFVKLGNAESRSKTGQDLIGQTDNLVLSPVVIAMWKPMAEALGYGTKPIGWSDILTLAKDPNGWGSLNHPEWGHFKFGHTQPEYSNSGLISILAEVYAATGKVSNLTLEDVNSPNTGQFLTNIEQAVVHYGSSTGFFGKKMFANGPTYLSAAVLYENMVIESYNQQNLPFPVVAVYPREGTFWSDHPIGIVQRDWVTPEHKEAAQIYIKYLLDKPQQQVAMEFGFRPADPSISLAAPIDAAHGVDPKQPQTTLEVPNADIVNATIQAWRKFKKHANVVLVLDRSGSMNDNQKMLNAKAGSLQMVQMLADEDRLSFLPFSTDMNWAGQGMLMSTSREQANQRINGTFAEGSTKLYDSIAAAYDYLSSNPQPDRISAIVVLTDGADTDSKQYNIGSLLQKIKPDEEKRPIRVFTIGYGGDAKTDVLGQIADTTQAKFYKGTPENIREVFKDIATFF